MNPKINQSFPSDRVSQQICANSEQIRFCVALWSIIWAADRKKESCESFGAGKSYCRKWQRIDKQNMTEN